jgi:hypothetical protein
VDLVEVNVVSTQPTQTVLALGDDPATRVALRIGIAAHLCVHFGGEHHLGTVHCCEGLGDNLFGLALGVDVRGVDKVDTGVERAVNDAHRLVVVGVTPFAEHHCPKTEGAYFHTGLAESVKVHTFTIFPSKVRRSRVDWEPGDEV